VKRIPHKSKYRNLIVGSMLSAAVVLGSVAPAFAQSGEVRALIDRINRLEQDLNDVQRQIYNGTPPPPRSLTSPSGGSSAATTGGGNVEGLALLSQKISALEAEQRRLTGVQEEATFKIGQVSTRLDKLVKDVDFRLTEIERKLGGTATTGVGPQGAAPVASPQSLTSGAAGSTTGPAGRNTVVVGGESLPEGSKVLGTLKAPEGNSASQSASSGLASASGSETTVASAAPAAGILPTGSPSDQYNYAISLVRADQYDEAETAFSEFLAKNKGHELAGNAQYWLGETFYVRGDFPNAASAFFEGYQNYPDNSKAADNLLKLAMTLGRMEQKDEACATFEQLDKQYAKLPPRLVRTANREKQKIGCAG
jgi:tol-pal system protein YbgF